MVSVCFFLACFIMGSGIPDDSKVLSEFKTGSISVCTIPGLADVCWIFEFGNLVAESVGKSSLHGDEF